MVVVVVVDSLVIGRAGRWAAPGKRIPDEEEVVVVEALVEWSWGRAAQIQRDGGKELVEAPGFGYPSSLEERAKGEEEEEEEEGDSEAKEETEEEGIVIVRHSSIHKSPTLDLASC